MKKKFPYVKFAFYSILIGWVSLLILFFLSPRKAQQFIFNYTGIQLHSKPYSSTLFNTNPLKINVNSIQNKLPFQSINLDKEMQDPISKHWKISKNQGIKKQLYNFKAVKGEYLKGHLIELKECSYFQLDTMYYSYPFILPQVKLFINQLAFRFQSRLVGTTFEKKTQFLITSLTRTHASIKRLMAKNKNAIKKSTHMHGTTFDISYLTFFQNGQQCSKKNACILKRILAEELFKLRGEKKCWVKYEYNQTCYHVVVNCKKN